MKITITNIPRRQCFHQGVFIDGNHLLPLEELRIRE